MENVVFCLRYCNDELLGSLQSYHTGDYASRKSETDPVTNRKIHYANEAGAFPMYTCLH